LKYEELEALVKEETTQREEEGCEATEIKEELKKSRGKAQENLSTS